MVTYTKTETGGAATTCPCFPSDAHGPGHLQDISQGLHSFAHRRHRCRVHSILLAPGGAELLLAAGFNSSEQWPSHMEFHITQASHLDDLHKNPTLLDLLDYQVGFRSFEV